MYDSRPGKKYSVAGSGECTPVRRSVPSINASVRFEWREHG